MEYIEISYNALYNAMVNLKGNSFKLWVYLHIPGVGLSYASCETYGIKKDAFYSAKQELVNKGYLKDMSEYDFTFDEYGSNMA